MCSYFQRIYIVITNRPFKIVLNFIKFVGNPGFHITLADKYYCNLELLRKL